MTVVGLANHKYNLEDMMYNPYALVELSLDGKSTYGRPIAFDSDVVDHKNMKNAFGNYVKPTKVVTTCHKCGQGIELSVMLGAPPFSVYQCTCPYCHPKACPIINPFNNPVKANKILVTELDPMVHDLGKVDTDMPSDTVAERRSVVDVMMTEEMKQQMNESNKVETDLADSVTNVKPRKPRSKTKNEPKNEPKRLVEPELNNELGEEVNFDDNDLIEP